MVFIHSMIFFKQIFLYRLNRPYNDTNNNIRLKNNRITDSAVSPVIGIMLMLIITVVLAAIISGYVGGMSDTKSRPPQLVMQTEVTKGNSVNVSMNIISAGEGIPTRDLKLITTWRHGNEQGGNSTLPGSEYPRGLIPQKFSPPLYKDFGDYTLFGGTRMIVNTTESSRQIFNNGTTNLDAGDIVTITFVHIPSQATIYKQEVVIGGNS